MSELSSTSASEAAKLLENSYRAVNIAFVQEWARYCETTGLDFGEISAAVRERPSHSNLLFPRLGVGGYCLTKDPLFAGASPFAAANGDELPVSPAHFPFCELAIEVNERTPAVVGEWFLATIGGGRGKKIHVLGYSYAPDVGDTRHSPSEKLIKFLKAESAVVDWSDPYVQDAEGNIGLPSTFKDYDAVFVAVGHHEYKSREFWESRVFPRLVVADAAGVLAELSEWLAEQEIRLLRVGSGRG